MALFVATGHSSRKRAAGVCPRPLHTWRRGGDPQLCRGGATPALATASQLSGTALEASVGLHQDMQTFSSLPGLTHVF